MGPKQHAYPALIAITKDLLLESRFPAIESQLLPSFTQTFRPSTDILLLYDRFSH